jgi:hypothetical protein
MDYNTLLEFLGKTIRLTLSTGYYYKGVVLDCSENAFTIRDIRGNRVSLSPQTIIQIEEVK